MSSPKKGEGGPGFSSLGKIDKKGTKEEKSEYEQGVNQFQRMQGNPHKASESVGKQK